MLRNFTSCCGSYPNRGFYFEMKNKTTFYIFFRIRYLFHTKLVTHESPVFGPGNKSHLLFPSDIETLTFTVFNASTLPPTSVKHLTILANESICYDVTGNAALVLCVRVPC